jgi:hypothetical protein
LTSLNIKNPKLTDEGISALLKLSKLSKLNLFHSRNITGPGLDISNTIHPKLTKLNINSCHKVTDAGLLAFVQKCPQLTSIDAQGCSISEVTANQLKDQHPTLKLLTSF